MIASFEVGSVFQIVDRATPTIARIAREMGDLAKLAADTKKNLQSLGTTSFAGLNRNLKMAIDQVTTLGGSVDKATAGMTAGADAAAVSVKALADSWAQVAASARAAGVASRASITPAMVGRGNPRNILGGGGGGLHIGGGSVPLGGGFHARYGGNAEMAGVGIAGYAAFLEAEVEDQIALAMFHLGRDDDKSREGLRKDIQAGLGLGFPVKDVGKSVQDLARLLKGTEGGGFNVIPEMLRAAAAEARLKGTSLDEAMKPMIELSHMTRQYSPEEMAKLAPMFSFLSTSTPMTLPQITKSLGYALPMLHTGAGIDPAQTMLLSVALQRAGITSTKSGTWLRELAVRAMPGQSDIQGKKWFQIHQKELAELGLLDQAGHATWFNGGKPDLMKMLGIAGEHLEHIPLERRLVLERSLFGAQGGGAMAVLSDPKVRQQMDALRKEYPDFAQKYHGFLENYSKDSPMQAGRQAWGDLQNVLLDLGRVALPPVIGALQELDSWFKTIHNDTPSFLVPKKGSLGEALGKGMGAGAIVGAPVGAIVGSVVPGPGTAAGAGLGAAIGAFSGGVISGSKWLWDGIAGSSKQGTEQGAKEGVKEGIKESLTGAKPMSYDSGPSGNSLLTPAMFTGDGFSINGTAYGIGSVGARAGVDPRGLVPFIRAEAIKRGIDPDVAVRVAQAEGLGAFVGDHGTSFGAFQLHVGGGLGDQFSRDTGLDPSDPKNERKTIEWAMKWISQHHTWAPWHGAGHVGVHASDGIRRDTDIGAIPPGQVHEHTHNLRIELDGRVIAKSTMKHIAKEGNKPMSGGRMPDYFTRPLGI